MNSVKCINVVLLEDIASLLSSHQCLEHAEAVNLWCGEVETGGAECPFLRGWQELA
jgi:hypothetical protein